MTGWGLVKTFGSFKIFVMDSDMGRALLARFIRRRTAMTEGADFRLKGAQGQPLHSPKLVDISEVEKIENYMRNWTTFGALGQSMQNLKSVDIGEREP